MGPPRRTDRPITDGGADPDRELPDGTTPLLRAVDLGSDAMVVDEVSLGGLTVRVGTAPSSPGWRRGPASRRQ
ncbi:hypothetical protein OG900_21945 [Streptomyces sp. NBC_00433]